MRKGEEKTEGRCPNCGYCEHCGQSTRPINVPIPAPYPQPYTAPYRRPRFWEEGVLPQPPYRVWCGETVTPEGLRELRSVTTSYEQGNVC